MNYSKRSFKKKFSEALLAHNYFPVPGPTLSSGLFFKIIKEKYILLLGLEFSRLYDERFTGSYYFSRSFEWGYMVRDYPVEAYQRVAYLLELKFRKKYLEEKYRKKGVTDAWWTGFNETNILSFISTIKITEPLFLAQKNLIRNINNCKKYMEYVGMLEATAKLAQSNSFSINMELKHQPKNYVKNIEPAWYQAAEIVLNNQVSELVQQSYVKLVAVDAWRVANLK